MSCTQVRPSIIQTAKAMTVALMTVIAVFLSPTAPAQNNNQPAPEDFTRVYAYTYDDVFQSV